MLDRTAPKPARLLPNLSAPWARIGPVECNLMQAALFFLLLTIPLTMLIFADPRQVGGVSAWLKPWKFSISFVVHLGTIALVWPYLAPAVRDGWRGQVIVRMLLATILFEGSYMASQAALGAGSHYNVSTPYTALMFSLMGIGAVLLVLATFLAGVAVARGPADEGSTGRGNPELHRAVALGLMLSGGLGLITGAALGANNGHFVGVPADPRDVVPILGWSREVGDLRVSHFIGLHALQILPVVGWLSTKTSPKTGLRLVTLAAVVVTALSLATLAQALMGRPLI